MNAALDRYAVVGNPVEHSRSPFIHARFAEQTGQALHYERLLAPLDAFADTVRRFAAEGGRGCNVTAPFKFEAVALAPHCSERAALAQAANTLRFDAEGWLADNTDGIGLVRDIQRNAGVDIAGRCVLLIGAGGASAGILGPLLEQQPARLVVANRTPDKAEALVRRHAALAADRGVVLAACALEASGGPFDIVLNASASSLAGAGVPVDPIVLRPGTLAVDLMYGSAAQPFLRWAAEHGAPGRDGLGMLVEQAAEAFWLWRGVRPDTVPVLAELRRRVDHGLP
jgi:shikimate dehydrogenase